MNKYNLDESKATQKEQMNLEKKTNGFSLFAAG